MLNPAPFAFSDALIEASPEALIQVHMGADGGPVGASAGRFVRATPARLWAVISDVGSYGGRIPMMEHVRLDGPFVTAHLRFGVSLFSTKFSFKVERFTEEGRHVELRWVEGEPHGLNIRLEVRPASTPDASILQVRIGFDIFSLGWLAKFFLKNHPEIRFGVFPGSALTLVETMRSVAEAKAS
jgi:ribosome-associated toxin RatA of RatAB toxin-antitoxin module